MHTTKKQTVTSCISVYKVTNVNNINLHITCKLAYKSYCITSVPIQIEQGIHNFSVSNYTNSAPRSRRLGIYTYLPIRIIIDLYSTYSNSYAQFNLRNIIVLLYVAMSIYKI